MTTLLYILIAVLCVSLVSLTGILLLSLKERLLQKTLLYFVSFAVGALFANVFFHLLPETIETSSDIHFSLTLVLVGILLSFVLEKFVHWHHCHNIHCDDVHPVGTIMLVGDAVHNITDGILIATTFMVSPELGITTTIAIMLHELPQEIGDFAVLIHSGWSKSKALLANFGTALSAFIGAGIVIFLQESIGNVEYYLLPIVAGNFLYIAGSDLIPELHKETRLRKAVLQLLVIIAGIMTIYLLTDDHGHHDEEHETDTHAEEIHIDE